MLPPATAAAAALSSPPLRLFPAPPSTSRRAANPRSPLLHTSTSSNRLSPVLRRPPRRSSTFSLLRATGVWEDPADGYGSEDEEIGGDELGDEREEDEWRGEGEQSGLAAIVNSFATESYNKELVQEVEQLLSPEEKAILQQNEAPDLSKISSVKWRPFHSLALSGQIPFMDKLLDYGINIDSVDKDSFTALHKAVVGKREAVISHLLRKGANPHVKGRDGATPLHYAVQVGAMQTVKLLIKYKADVNVADNEGWTPLHVAVQSRSRDIAKVLLVNDADKTRRNKDGKTALDLSLCYGKDFKSYEIAKLLKLVPENRDP